MRMRAENRRCGKGRRLFRTLDLSPAALAQADFGLLTDAGEIGLIKLIGQYPRVVEAAANAHEPHRVAFYLHDLASELHGHWTTRQRSATITIC